MVPQRTFRWLKWLPILFGVIGGIIGWHTIDSLDSIALRVVSGFAFGCSMGFIGLVKTGPLQIAHLMAGVAALLFFIAITIVALASPKGTMGTILLAAVLAAGLFWALTRHRVE